MLRALCATLAALPLLAGLAACKPAPTDAPPPPPATSTAPAPMPTPPASAASQ
jgi:hypothetical protein